MVVMEAAEDKQLKCGPIIRTGPGQYQHSHPGLVHSFLGPKVKPLPWLAKLR